MKAGKNSATAVPPLASQKAVAYKRRGGGRKGPELLATSADRRNEVCWRHSNRLAVKTSAETVQMRIMLSRTPLATCSVKPDVCERTGYCTKGNSMLPACSRSPFCYRAPGDGDVSTMEATSIKNLQHKVCFLQCQIEAMR